jgi:protein-L-isoaspartate(D-aspartate) O-methyltransferase
LVTAGAPAVPASLVEQLADPGRLVLPVGDRDLQTLEVIDKVGGKITRRQLVECAFVPLLGQEGWEER